MYKIIDKPDGSFQILDDKGENFGVFGDRLEALASLGVLNAKHLIPEIKTKIKTPETPHKKTIPAKIKKPTIKSPVIKAKRGRPKKR